MPTIIIANYNNAKYLPKLLESIMESSFLPEEIILVDDCSSDNSKQILGKYQKEISILKCFFLDKNVGVANARNLAIQNTKTKYLAIIDSDDYIHPEKIKLQFEFLEKNPAIDLIGSNCQYFDSESQEFIRKSNFPLETKNILKQFKNGENGVLNGTLMGKTKLFQKHLYNQKSVWAEDYDLFARMLIDGAKFANLPQALTFVRIHRNSATSNLKLDTIQKIFHFKDKYFQSKTSNFRIKQEFYHLYFYRKYLLKKNAIPKYFYLLLAALFRPDKIIA